MVAPITGRGPIRHSATIPCGRKAAGALPHGSGRGQALTPRLDRVFIGSCTTPSRTAPRPQARGRESAPLQALGYLGLVKRQAEEEGLDETPRRGL